MIVYHGSIAIVDKPDVNHSYRPLDFGSGFFVTSVREQAERWARRKVDLLGSGKAIIRKAFGIYVISRGVNHEWGGIGTDISGEA